MSEIYGGIVPISDYLTYDILPDYWLRPGVSLRMHADPLGPVNKIISIVRHNSDHTTTVLKSKLYPVKQGSTVILGEEGSEWNMGPGWRALTDTAIEEPKPHVWYVEVDYHRIIEIPWGAALPDPAPVMPWYRQARWRALNWRAYRARVASKIARKLGYQRIGECDCDDY